MLQRIRALSLDVAAGALAGGLLACAASAARMPWAWYLALPLSVWLIYTADHLLDARRIGRNGAPESFRHRFHYRHFRVLAALWILGAGACGVVVLWGLPRELLIWGGVLGLLAVFHLAFAQWTGFLYFPRELSVALIYTAGVWFGPLVLAGSVGGPSDHGAGPGPGPTGFGAGYGPWPLFVALMGLFFLAAFSNLIVFSLFEREADEREAPNSLVLRLGEARSIALLWIMAGLAPLGALWLALRSVEYVLFGGRAVVDEALFTGAAGLVLLLAVTLPLYVYQSGERYRVRERYRGLLDGIFLLYALPWLLWITF